MMNYEIFKDVVEEKFMDYMPDEFKNAKLAIAPVQKVNVTLDGLSILDTGRNISPTIYINDMYERYKENGDLENTIISACNFMAKTISETAPVFDVDNFLNSAKDKIVFQLINTEQNKSFLEKVPHREFQDLSIIYKVVINVEKESVHNVQVTNELSKRLGMDEEMLFKSAAENTRRILPPTVHNETEYLMKAVDIGINGYVLKDSESAELKKAIFTIADGETYIQPSLIPALNSKMIEKNEDELKIDALTKRELEVLKEMAVGKFNRDIAKEMKISERTVKNHISSIFKKLEVTDRTQAAVFAIRNNIIQIM